MCVPRHRLLRRVFRDTCYDQYICFTLRCITAAIHLLTPQRTTIQNTVIQCITIPYETIHFSTIQPHHSLARLSFPVCIQFATSPNRVSIHSTPNYEIALPANTQVLFAINSHTLRNHHTADVTSGDQQRHQLTPTVSSTVSNIYRAQSKHTTSSRQKTRSN